MDGSEVGERNLVHTPWRRFQRPRDSSAGDKRSVPVLSKLILQSLEAITPKDNPDSYLRYDFTIFSDQDDSDETRVYRLDRLLGFWTYA